ncbi:MAG TPA: glycosyltransferase family 4 protein [Blastocatellia bacterium]|nr:glycosyltransferase family 4 protein [Blastocatellia bacterium]
MKILQVSSAESWGGGERHVADLTRALVERGHRLHLAVRPASPLRTPLRDLPVTWHELGLRNAADLSSARRLDALIRAEGIEVLHAHVARDYPVCGLAARVAGARFFLTRHHFHPLRSNPLYRWALAGAERLIAVSESVRAKLIEAFPTLAPRVVVIPNWVDLRAAGRVERDQARAHLGIARPLAVGVIGQLTPLKRQDLFIRAARELGNEIEFLIIGEPGPDDADYARRLREAAGHDVRFTGEIGDLPAYLKALDVVVAPSENEAFSLAVAEAMAAGRAVLASRAGGLVEIVEDGITGLLVTPGDVGELTEGLSRLLADETLRARLGAAARERARERFDREHVINRIERLYLT